MVRFENIAAVFRAPDFGTVCKLQTHITAFFRLCTWFYYCLYIICFNIKCRYNRRFIIWRHHEKRKNAFRHGNNNDNNNNNSLFTAVVIVAANIIYLLLLCIIINVYYDIIGQSNVINSKSCKGGGLRRRPSGTVRLVA